jgi:glycosyltransferase involved in cell wall biosynthesis
MISVVIPALNEQDSIADTVTRVRQTLAETQVPFEVVVVNDGSRDETGGRAEAAGARVISHPHNVGYGQSLKDGIRAARYDMIVISDADGTYPIEAIPRLLDRYREGFDMVVGARTGKYYRESVLKMPLRWLLRKIVEFTTTRSIPDINSGLRVFSRSTVMSYYDHLCDTFSFTTSMTLAYMMTGRFVTYEPIDYNDRVGKSKVKLFRDSLKTFQYILEAAIYYNPLRIFLLMSWLVGLGGVASFGLALATHLNVFFFVGVGCVIAAALILSMGMLAVLLRQIMLSSSPVKQSQPEWEASRLERDAHEDVDAAPEPSRIPMGLRKRG